jgi:hypothetical protein
MECVVENRAVVSRYYLEQLQISLERDGDERLAQALGECDTIRFGLSWITSLVVAILLALFVRSAFLADGWHCLFIFWDGAILFMISRAVDQRLVSHFNRRFYESIPDDLRWCFRRMP